ncbi:hypothetical protein DAI22_06g201903 [Oryza sativa Japonica Group]|nr:hypothetical protein DAI22_06g201903 [Oryza sativa Japonica Group]
MKPTKLSKFLPNCRIVATSVEDSLVCSKSAQWRRHRKHTSAWGWKKVIPSSPCRRARKEVIPSSPCRRARSYSPPVACAVARSSGATAFGRRSLRRRPAPPSPSPAPPPCSAAEACAAVCDAALRRRSLRRRPAPPPFAAIDCAGAIACAASKKLGFRCGERMATGLFEPDRSWSKHT